VPLDVTLSATTAGSVSIGADISTGGGTFFAQAQQGGAITQAAATTITAGSSGAILAVALGGAIELDGTINAIGAISVTSAGTIALRRDLRGEWTRAEAARPYHGGALDRLPVAQGDAALGQRRDAHAEPGFHASLAQRLLDHRTRLGPHGRRNGFVAVDEFQMTSCENIYCAGEPTGIGGVEASLVEGSIAGFAAAGNERAARELFSKRSKMRKFGDSLNKAFALRDELRHTADDDTLICRCEDITYGQLKEFDSRRSAKLQTRCGMGACQGRVCGAATEFLFGWEADTVRPPIFPVKMENL